MQNPAEISQEQKKDEVEIKRKNERFELPKDNVLDAIINELNSQLSNHKNPLKAVFKELLNATLIELDKTLTEFYAKLLARYISQYVYRTSKKETALAIKFIEDVRSKNPNLFEGMVKFLRLYFNESIPASLESYLNKLATPKKTINELFRIVSQSQLKDPVARIIYIKFHEENYINVSEFKLNSFLRLKSHAKKLELVLNIVLGANEETTLTQFFKLYGPEVFSFFFNKMDLLLIFLKGNELEIAYNILRYAATNKIYFDGENQDNDLKKMNKVAQLIESLPSKKGFSGHLKTMWPLYYTSYESYKRFKYGTCLEYNNLTSQFPAHANTLKKMKRRRDALEEYFENQDSFFNRIYPYIITTHRVTLLNSSILIHLPRHNLTESETSLIINYDCKAVLENLRIELAKIYTDEAWILNKEDHWKIEVDPHTNYALLTITGNQEEIEDVIELLQYPPLKMHLGFLTIAEVKEYMIMPDLSAIWPSLFPTSTKISENDDNPYKPFGLSDKNEAYKLLINNVGSIIDPLLPIFLEIVTDLKCLEIMEDKLKKIEKDELIKSCHGQDKEIEEDAETMVDSLKNFSERYHSFMFALKQIFAFGVVGRYATKPKIMEVFLDFIFSSNPHRVYPTILNAIALIQGKNLRLMTPDEKGDLFNYPGHLATTKFKQTIYLMLDINGKVTELQTGNEVKKDNEVTKIQPENNVKMEHIINYCLLPPPRWGNVEPREGKQAETTNELDVGKQFHLSACKSESS